MTLALSHFQQILGGGTSGQGPQQRVSVVLEHNPVQVRSCINQQAQEKVQKQTLSKQYSGSAQDLMISLPLMLVGSCKLYTLRHTGAYSPAQIPVKEALMDESVPLGYQETR